MSSAWSGGNNSRRVYIWYFSHSDSFGKLLVMPLLSLSGGVETTEVSCTPSMTYLLGMIKGGVGSVMLNCEY